MFKNLVRVNPRNHLWNLRAGKRAYAVQTPGAPIAEVFNNRTKWLQKERAAQDKVTSRQVDYLRDEVASRLCDRLFVRLPEFYTSQYQIEN